MNSTLRNAWRRFKCFLGSHPQELMTWTTDHDEPFDAIQFTCNACGRKWWLDEEDD